MKRICDESKCTGCSSCFNVCPQKCIDMAYLNDGFLHPVIDEKKCINCGLCIKTCPVFKKIDDDKHSSAYYAFNKCDSLRKTSSSGGVFIELAKYVISNNGVVFAPSYDHSCNVVHQKCDKESDLFNFMGSKYVQSEVGSTFSNVKEYLEKGYCVLFSGTPCQVSGLISYLGKRYEKLITQDIVCHGVPSPLVWQSYLSSLSKKYGSRIMNVAFRDKESGWNNYSIKFVFDGCSFSELASQNMYFLSYAMGMSVRQSCGACNFKQIHRESDITLGDFWGINEIDPNINNDKGVSLILVHTKKGEELLNSIGLNLFIKSTDVMKSIKHNQSVFSSCKVSPLRNKFVRDSQRLSFDKAFKKYCGSGILAKIRRKIGV